MVSAEPDVGHRVCLNGASALTLTRLRAARGAWGDMVEALPNEVEVIALFVDDIASSRASTTH
ncbi:hypothetical protein EAS54_29305 [Bradyrhizobium guangzhouense]|nr:hypothetical protein EAS54_29305 [Bradyrhizobium guangzhouense]